MSNQDFNFGNVWPTTRPTQTTGVGQDQNPDPFPAPWTTTRLPPLAPNPNLADYIPSSRNRASSAWGQPDWALQGLMSQPGNVPPSPYMPDRNQIPGLINNLTRSLGRYGSGSVGMPMIAAGLAFGRGAKAFAEGQMARAKLEYQQFRQHMEEALWKQQQEMREMSAAYHEFGPDPNNPSDHGEPEKLHQRVREIAVQFQNHHLQNLLDTGDLAAVDKYLKWYDGVGQDGLKALQAEKIRAGIALDKARTKAVEAGTAGAAALTAGDTGESDEPTVTPDGTQQTAPSGADTDTNQPEQPDQEPTVTPPAPDQGTASDQGATAPAPGPGGGAAAAPTPAPAVAPPAGGPAPAAAPAGPAPAPAGAAPPPAPGQGAQAAPAEPQQGAWANISRPQQQAPAAPGQVDYTQPGAPTPQFPPGARAQAGPDALPRIWQYNIAKPTYVPPGYTLDRLNNEARQYFETEKDVYPWRQGPEGAILAQRNEAIHRRANQLTIYVNRVLDAYRPGQDSEQQLWQKLAQADPSLVARAQGIINGGQRLPGGSGSGATGRYAALLDSIVARVRPGPGVQQKPQLYQKIVGDYSPGGYVGKAVYATNRLAAAGVEVWKAAMALPPGTIPQNLWNEFIAGKLTGSNKYSNFFVAWRDYASEVARLERMGSGAEGDITAQTQIIPPSATKEQIFGALRIHMNNAMAPLQLAKKYWDSLDMRMPMPNYDENAARIIDTFRTRLDDKGGFSGAPPSPAFPGEPGAAPAQAATPETKTIGGKTYRKINGEWYAD